MDEVISRQAAIDASCKDWCGCTYANCPNQFDLESERFCDGCDTVVILKKLPSAQPDTRLEKIADLVDGSIDHFDLEDAMDLLYQIKDVLNG